MTIGTPLRSTAPQPPAAHPRRWPIGRVIAGSLTVGVLAALLLDLVVFAGAAEYVITGSTLLAFGLGWALLAGLSTRFTSSPQRWARIPAIVMATTGAALLAFAPGNTGLTAMGWLWPPVGIALAAWMFLQSRRTLVSRSRWLLYPVMALMALAAIGAGIENVAQLSDRNAAARPGTTYDVGGYQLHLDCRGSGNPTVVLLNGLGETSGWWERITPVLATDTRVCAYDRAGQGWSDDAPRPNDAARTVEDLHTLLARAAENGPFVLAGHSIGGTYALTYAARYPEQVAGMVLLDSSSPYQTTLVSGFTASYELSRRAVALLPSVARLGLGRLAPASAISHLPQPAAEQVRTFATDARGYRNFRDEQSVLIDLFEQAQQCTSLDDKPLVVVTATDTMETTAGWATAQDQLAALSTNSSHRVATFTHSGLLDEADGADVSARAVDDVVHAVRTGEQVDGS
jgi:pimeloyl-ACP methyl ester carboxylesterase